jgi:hypothetical protein
MGYVATWEVVYYKFMPDFAHRYTAYELTKAKQAGATDAQIEAQTTKLAEFRENVSESLHQRGAYLSRGT